MNKKLLFFFSFILVSVLNAASHGMTQQTAINRAKYYKWIAVQVTNPDPKQLVVENGDVVYLLSTYKGSF